MEISFVSRVVALSDIPEGKVIMTINRSVMLCAKFGRGPCASISPLLEKFVDNVTLELTILLLYHKCIPDSYFKPYLNSLPEFFSVPAFWDVDVFQAFKGSLTLKRAVSSLQSR
jgi:hypothetical protein